MKSSRDFGLNSNFGSTGIINRGFSNNNKSFPRTSGFIPPRPMQLQSTNISLGLTERKITNKEINLCKTVGKVVNATTYATTFLRVNHVVHKLVESPLGTALFHSKISKLSQAMGKTSEKLAETGCRKSIVVEKQLSKQLEKGLQVISPRAMFRNGVYLTKSQRIEASAELAMAKYKK